ncbi:MAG TPA: diguanylate cyclase [Anaerolineaceae bacterium]
MQKRMQILLVDDDEDEYVLLKDHLRHMPVGRKQVEYSLDWAPDLSGALAASREKLYDLYLVDYNLGASTGLDVMRAWAEQGSHVPVVLLTGQSSYEIDLAAMQEGASDFLVKSQVNPFLLERVIRYTLERKRAKDELEERVRERTAELAALNEELQAEITARQRVEAELRASEQRLRTLSETTSAAIFIEQDGLIRYANSAARFVTGYSPRELLDTPVWQLAHPSYREGLRRRSLTQQWGAGLPVRFELKIITKNGAERWVDITTGEMDYDGRSAAVITAFDITERDLAEKQLQEAKAELENRVQERTAELRLANQQLQEVLSELEIEQARLHTIIENAPGGIVVTDHLGRIILANPAAEQMMGQPLANLPDDPAAFTFQVCHLDGTPLTADEMILARAAIKKETVLDEELLVRRTDGTQRYIVLNARPISDSREAPGGAIGVFQDITQRKQREHDLQENALRGEVLATLSQAFAQAELDYQRILNTIAIKITETIADGCIVRLESANGQWLDPVSAHFRDPQTQQSLADQPSLLREPVREGTLGRVFTSGEPLALFHTQTDEVLELLRPEMHDVIMQLNMCSLIITPLRAPDRTMGTLSFIRSHPNRPYTERDLAFFQDLSERAALAIENAMLHAQVKQMAQHDALTGQFNRRAFFDLGRDQVTEHRKSHQPLAAIMLDIDHFKRINDHYGHAIGDEILLRVTDQCRKNIRHTDILGRYGGDEYVILLPRTDLSTARGIADRIHASISTQPLETKSGEILVTVSLGVAEADSRMQNIQSLLDMADKALYRAKQRGRNRVEISRMAAGREKAANQ